MWRLAVSFLALLLTLTIALPDSDAVYRLGKRKGPDDVLQAMDLPQRLDQLGQGKLFAEGGYSEEGVWAKMEAVIAAPPALVWQLFIQSNDWKDYGIPFMFDSRAVSREIVEAAKSLSDVNDVYKLIGNRVFNPTESRREGGKWTSYVFQFVNVKWPLPDRWVINENRYDETKIAADVYRVTWDMQAGDVKINQGSMVLQPFEGDPEKTRMVYTVNVHPGSWVPRFLMKGVVTKSMPDAIRAIRRAAGKAQHKPPWPPPLADPQ